MKSVYMSLLLLLVFLQTAMSQQLKQDKQKNEYKVQAELVNQYQLDLENIKLVKFSAKDGISPAYPKLVVLSEKAKRGHWRESEIIFYDANRTVTFRKKLGLKSSIHKISEHGNFVIISTIQKDVIKEADGLIVFELYRSDGKKLWSKQYNFDWDGANQKFYYISDADGVTVESEPMNGTLKFFDPQGNLLKEVSFYKEKSWDESRMSFGRFSENGEYFVLGASEMPGLTFQYYSGVILYDKLGNEKWRFEFAEEERASSLLNISQTGKYILLSTQTKAATYLINLDGQLIKKYNNIDGLVSFYSERYGIIITGSGAKIISLNNGEILYKVDAPTQIKSIDILKDLQLVGITCGLFYRKPEDDKEKLYYPEIVIKDFNNKLLWSKKYADNDCTALNFQFTDSGNSFNAMIGKNIVQYNLSW